MTDNYSEQLNNVLNYSTQEAERLGNDYIGPEHLLLGLLRNGKGKAIELLNNQQVDLLKIKKNIESQIRTDCDPNGQKIPMLKSVERIMKIMVLESRSLTDKITDTEHLLLAILKEKNNIAVDALAQENFNYDTVRAILDKSEKTPSMGANFEEDEEDDEEPRKKKNAPVPPTAQNAGKSDTPALDTFGTDITKSAAENKLEIGRAHV